MSAFGRKNGAGGMAAGARPNFGVARPMKGGGAAPKSAPEAAPPGGDQFPPLPGQGNGSVPQDIGAMANPWSFFWDEKAKAYSGYTGILDDNRESLGHALQAKGGNDHFGQRQTTM